MLLILSLRAVMNIFVEKAFPASLEWGLTNRIIGLNEIKLFLQWVSNELGLPVFTPLHSSLPLNLIESMECSRNVPALPGPSLKKPASFCLCIPVRSLTTLRPSCCEKASLALWSSQAISQQLSCPLTLSLASVCQPVSRASLS